MKKYVLVETPMFGTRKKIRAVSESVVLLLNSQMKFHGLNFHQRALQEQASRDQYLLGYIFGATKVPSDLAGFKEKQFGHAIREVMLAVIKTDGYFLERESPVRIAGMKDGFQEAREMLGAFVGGKQELSLDKLNAHLSDCYERVEEDLATESAVVMPTPTQSLSRGNGSMFGNFFLKIKVRQELLSVFREAGLDHNPYSLDPVCKAVYYDLLSELLPEIVGEGIKDPIQIASAVITVALQRTPDESDAQNTLAYLYGLLSMRSSS